MVLSIGRRAGLDEADLDELTQRVRVRLWRAQDGQADADAVTASYVHQAARSAAIDIVRTRRGLLAGNSEPITDATVLSDPAPLPDVALEREETSAQILAAMDSLSPDRRTAVMLHLAGYSRDEISGMLGWQGARTRNLIHRGIADLRERLTALGLSPDGTR